MRIFFQYFIFKPIEIFLLALFPISMNSETRTNRLTRKTQQLITGFRRRRKNNHNNSNKYESYHPNLFIVCCRMIFTKKTEDNSETDYGKRRKTHVRRAVPSRSPIAVKYGMHTLSGSRSCLQTKATIHWAM